MKSIGLFALLLTLYAWKPTHSGNYLFVVLKPIPACDGKCNNYEVIEFNRKSAEDCKKLEDSCKLKYDSKTTYTTVAPTEGVIFYKYNQFVTNCDCKIKGVHKSFSIAQAKSEMDSVVAAARVKRPKAYHNYEVMKTWGK